MRQDDPAKCTAARLRRFNLARRVNNFRQIHPSTVVLNPTSRLTITNLDRLAVERYGIVALDCSWNRSEDVFTLNVPGQPRRLPLLLAGNPTNYSALGKLSTAEAFAAALFITGFAKEAARVLEPFKWGRTFLSLNKNPLHAYAKAKPEEVSSVEAAYF